MELFLTICLLLFFTLVVVLAKSRIEFNRRVTSILLICFYISAVLAIISVYLFSKEIFFISDFMNKTVIWYPIFFAGIILGGSKNMKNRIHKAFMYLFIFVGFMFAILIFVPFVGLSINAYFGSSSGKVYYDDDQFLVQESFYGILSKPYQPDIYRKKFGLFVVRETSKLPCKINRDIFVNVEEEPNYYEITYLNPDGSSNCSTRLPKN